MTQGSDGGWCPFRPGPEDLKAIAGDVADIRPIQDTLWGVHPDLRCSDRVAHEYQIAGGKVVLRVADELPAPLAGVGLFQPGAVHAGIGRISTGLGTPHVETNPDFLGLMLAFQAKAGQRVDFLGLNDPSAPTDDHRDFMDVLRATGASAGARIPLAGEWGEYDVAKLVAEQAQFADALKDRMGWVKAGRTLLHITRQTIRTFHSSTAWQSYWTGIEETGGAAGKFTMVPTRDENHPPGFRPGERHLSQDWKVRQGRGDIEFRLYWIAYLDEARTSTKTLAAPWGEGHKQPVGTVAFPRADLDAEEPTLWAMLAAEMGANPGNWIHDRDDTIREPATAFGLARKIAYQRSQDGRHALDPQAYQCVFDTGQLSASLAAMLRARRLEKRQAGHRDGAPQ